MYGSSLGGDFDSKKFWGGLLTNTIASLTNSITGNTSSGVTAPTVKPPKEMMVAEDGTLVATTKAIWPIFLVGGLGVLALGGVILLKMKKK